LSVGFHDQPVKEMSRMQMVNQVFIERGSEHGIRRPTALLAVVTVVTAIALGNAVPRELDLAVTVAPTAVTVDGNAELVYELHLRNTSDDSIRLRRVDVVDRASGAPVTSFAAAALRQRFAQLGGSTVPADPGVMAAGSTAVLYIEFAQAVHEVTRTLHHRLEYERVLPGQTFPQVIEGADTVVAVEAPVSLAAPLRGGPWVAVYNAAWDRGHRRVLFAPDGRQRIPGRFAIDWIKLDANGRTGSDDDIVAHAFGYGEDVLAVSDARVASIRDDVAEEMRISRNRKHALQDASGNYVALDLGRDRYVFYEHLKPGSVRVKVGGRVRRGEVIAKLGFTGDSTGPHLHLHVSDANSPLAAEGMPFVLDRFDVVGAYRDIADLGKRPWSPAAGTRRRQMERPASNVVVDFGMSTR
jgi:hypothetical protein